MLGVSANVEEPEVNGMRRWTQEIAKPMAPILLFSESHKMSIYELSSDCRARIVPWSSC